MTYAVLTLDDFVGLIPVFAVLWFLFNGLVRCLSLVLPVSNQRQTKESSINSSSANNTLNAKSVLFFLFLSYLLSPLATLLHLQSTRHNYGFFSSNVNITRSNSGLYDLIHGVDPQLQDMMAKMPSLWRGPQPPWFLGNRHLQFVPWMIQNEIHRQEGIPYQRIDLDVTACVEKSVGNDCIRSPQMTDTISLDVFPPFDDNDDDDNNNNSQNQHPGFHSGSPIILVSPGLRCESQDIPGQMLVRRAYGAGFRTVVVNRRGHTPQRRLKAPRWNLFGDVDDLEQVYWFVRKELAAADTPLFLHGVSSGTAVVVSALAEWDRRRLWQEQASLLRADRNTATSNNISNTVDNINIIRRPAPSFVGSVSIVPGYDISKVMLPDRFKYPYNTILTESVKDHFIRQNEDVLRQFNSIAVDQALRASNLQDLLNAVAPFAGYPNSTEYYKGENPVNHLQYITTPKLVINSIDDPCCNVHNIYEPSPYPQHHGKTYAQIVAESQRGLLAVTQSGSHCPFLDSAGPYHVWPSWVRDPIRTQGSSSSSFDGWMLDSWADRVSLEFYQAALEVYNDRRFMH